MAAEQPFDDREERYFLAEILKDAPVPPAYLLECITQLGIQPRWHEIALPNGRSVSACQRAFDRLVGRTKGYAVPLQPGESSTQATKAKKRSNVVAPTTPGYAAQGYSSFQSVNDPSTPQAQASAAHSPGTSQKKRGRPTKDVMAQRAAEAAARGEVYPPPKRPKNKPSGEGAVPASSTAVPGGDDQSANIGGFPTEGTPASSAPKKRLPKTKAPKEARDSLEATANAAYILGGQGEAQTQFSVQESQGASHGLPEGNLLAGLQEHAQFTRPATTEGGTSMQLEQQSEQHAEQIPEQIPEQDPVQQAEQQSEQQPQLSPQPETEAYQTPYQQDSAV